MPERISAGRRLRIQHRAEAEIRRYAGDHALWHKHVHNVTLDAAQILKMHEMDESPLTVDVSCRRTGKTAVKELWLLEHNATNADQELGIVSPRQAQSIVNLRTYHLEAIRRSPILSGFIAYRNGRRQASDTYYQFTNRSRAEAYGIMAQVDGGDLTTASLEEVDDMPHERLYGNFLLMMGATRRMGASSSAKNEPIIRITGVFKGADTLSRLIDSGLYHLLPTVNVYLGIEMGILQGSFMEQMREELSADEYIRQLLCRNVSSRNLIWELHARKAIQVGLAAGIEIEEPLPGAAYRKRGLLSFGYDAAGHGESPEASKHALVVTEQIGNFVCFIFARTWPAGADDTRVKNDLKGYWRYFSPDIAHGDAYGVGMLTQLCDELFTEALTSTDRRAVGDGESTASTWNEWPFSPIRFEGMTKHQMATALRTAFHNGNAALPYVDDKEGAELAEPAVADMLDLQRQITNIRPDQTKAGYASYRMVNPKLGDDLFDAAMASVWGLVTRGATAVATVIETISRNRAAVLGESRRRLLPSDPVH